MKSLIINKKRVKKFQRHHSCRYKRVKKNWRKPKGIDSCVRRRFKGKTIMPNIGYGSDKKTRNLSPRGLYKFKIQTPRDLQILLVSNKKFEIEIGKRVGKFKRKEIIDKALVSDIKVVNLPKKNNLPLN